MKKKRKSLIAFLAAIFFQFSIFAVPSIKVNAAADITNSFPFITSVSIKDVNGNDLGNNIDKSSEIHINYTWAIPNGQVVNAGDYYTMQLPNQIKIAAAIDQPIINTEDGNTVANMHIDTSGKVTITFTAYASEHSNVQGALFVDCHFNSSEIGNANPITISFTIPGVGVIVSGPFNFKQPDPTTQKSGIYDSASDEITWTVTANKEGVSINNASIEDSINAGQVFVDNSVLINGNPVVLGVNYTYDAVSKKLNFNLGNINTQQVITFKTSVKADLAAKPQGTYNYSNTAALNYTDNGTRKTIASNLATIPVAVKYISKDGSYDTQYKRINWTIKVNESGRTITNASVTDAIPAGLIIDASSIKLNGIGGKTPGVDYSISGQNFTYNLGNINSLQTITFSTAVDTSVYNSNITKNYNNTAYLLGDGVLSGTSASKNVGVTPNILQKQGVGYNAATGIITWRITVNNNKTDVSAGALVTDNIPIGQLYVPGSAKLDSVTLDDSGYSAASVGDTIKTGTFTYTFAGAFSDTHIITFQTQLTDAKAYRANYSGTYSNAVNLKAAGINQDAWGNQPVSSEIIKKTGTDYNYATREITWRVVINKNKMPITNAVVTDNISVGQEFVENSASIDNGASSNGFSYTAVVGDASKTGTLVYNFPAGGTINDTYTITFKTKITDLSIFNTNGSMTLNNTAAITGDEIPSEGNNFSTGSQTVNNAVINKTPSYTYGNSYIDWTVNVNSNYSIPMAGAALSDKLQDGLSLNTDTVELYKASVNSNGTLTAGAKVILTGENVKYDSSTRQFDFKFPADAGTEAYILKFTTDVTKAGNYSNTIEFKGASVDQSSTGTQNGVWFSSGGGWGSGVTGSITVTKVDSNDVTKKLSGAVFQLIDQYGNVKAISAATGADGIALFDKLKYDTDYSVKETTPPSGYNLSSEVYTFQVNGSAGQKDITYNYVDTKIKGNIDFTKTGEDGQGLQGAEFSLYKESDSTLISPIAAAISDETGKVQFKDIDYGNYKIKETKAPEGFNLSSIVLTASFSGDYTNASVTVTPNAVANTKIRGGIKITKTDAGTSAPLEGAIISVYTSNGNAVNGGLEGKTGADGTVTFDNLSYGEYYYTETEAPEGYVQNTDKHPFSIKDNGVTLQSTLSNTKITGGIKITKTDSSSSKPVPGATVTIYTSDGKPVGSSLEGKTGLDGTIEFNNLYYGDYYFLETSAPEGYLLNTDKHPFSIKDYGVILEDTFSDEKITGTVEVKKMGEEGSYLGDTEFTIFDANGKAVKSAVTDENGFAKFFNIEYGKYIVMETRPPKGYTISDEAIAVEVNGAEVGETYSAGTITDARIRASVQLKKLDQDGKPLKGAEFTLYDSKGNGVETSVSGEDGIILFKNLVYGNYSVIETKAPEGYISSKESIEVSIEKDGAVYSYEVKNNKIIETFDIDNTDVDRKASIRLPKTGGIIDSTLLFSTGILVILVGTSFLVRRKKVKKNN